MPRNQLRIFSEGLYLKSNPVEHNELHDGNVDRHRRVMCRRYTNCVTYAASLNWKGFTCANCHIKNDCITTEENHDDMEGLAGVLHAINVGTDVEPTTERTGWYVRRGP